jgi:hypothetical protein
MTVHSSFLPVQLSHLLVTSHQKRVVPHVAKKRKLPSFVESIAVVSTKCIAMVVRKRDIMKERI